MKVLSKIVKYQLQDAFRSRWLAAYTLFLIVFSYGLISLTGDSSKVVLSLMNLVITIVPLISIVFGTVYIYNSRDYIVFMLSQPIDRKILFLGVYLGMCISLAAAFITGIILPVLFYANYFVNNLADIFIVLISGIFETIIFIGLSFYIAIKNENKLKGFGISIFCWLFFTVIFDGILLMILQQFQDYPLEKVSLLIISINPIDLARIWITLSYDISSLMGYTSAVIKDIYGTGWGSFITILLLTVWALWPLLLGLRNFNRKDM
ncbi:MAG: ABC transporter permease [Bacteroidetes bacterium]|nr:ABC transporter permease [Bacteroidota bacterium]